MPLQEVLELDREHRALLTELEAARAAHNRLSQEINRRVKAGALLVTCPIAPCEAGDASRRWSRDCAEVEARLQDLPWRSPTSPTLMFRAGTDQTANRIVRASGEQVRLPWPWPHWEIALGARSPDPRATAIAGSRFPC